MNHRMRFERGNGAPGSARGSTDGWKDRFLRGFGATLLPAPGQSARKAQPEDENRDKESAHFFFSLRIALFTLVGEVPPGKSLARTARSADRQAKASFSKTGENR